MKYLVFSLLVLANVVGYALAVAPMFVTYAPVPPDSVNCATCVSPEVQRALSLTAQHWISGFVSHVRSISPWLALVAALNITVCGWLLFRRVSPNNSFKPKPLRGSA